MALADLIKENKNIKYVKMKGNKLGDSGVKALCKALIYTDVSSIDLSYNNFTIEGISHMKNLSYFNNKLKLINVKQNNINEKLFNRMIGEFVQNGVRIEK